MKIVLLKIVRIICILPIVFLMFASIYNAFNGMTFLDEKYYGIDAFQLTIALCFGVLFWLWIICIMGIIATTIFIKKYE